MQGLGRADGPCGAGGTEPAWRPGCPGRAPSSNITGVSRNAEVARATARRSSASSPNVELTNTRSRRSGVRMTGSSRGPWLTDRPRAGPPRKSATSHPGQQARVSTQSVSQHRLAQATKSSVRSYRSPVPTTSSTAAIHCSGVDPHLVVGGSSVEVREHRLCRNGACSLLCRRCRDRMLRATTPCPFRRDARRTSPVGGRIDAGLPRSHQRR